MVEHILHVSTPFNRLIENKKALLNNSAFIMKHGVPRYNADQFSLPDLAYFYSRIWPSPFTKYFSEVNDSSPIGPYACNFVVEIPISAPRPN